MIRKILSVLFFILGGFFAYTICILAFMHQPEIGAAKFAIIGGFSVPAIILLLIGAAINRFRNWKLSTGITLLSSVGITLFGVITIMSILFSPEYAELFPDNSLNDSFAIFSDYITGFVVMAILAGLGGFLVITHKKSAVPEALPDRENLGDTDTA